MSRKLSNLRISRVALVDKGANYDTKTGDGAHIILFKSAPTVSSVHVDVPIGTKPSANKKQEKNVKKSIVKQFLGLFTETDVEKRNAKAIELAKEVEADDDPTSDSDDEAKKKEMKKIADDAVIEVSKAHVAEVTELKKRLEASEAASTVEKNARLDREMTDVLKSFKSTPFDMATDVAKFRKMKEDAPEAYARTMEIMKAADAQISAGALYKNFGSSATGGGSAWEKIEAKADALVEKNAGNLSREAALEKVMLAHPALVAEYRKEQQ